MREVVLATCAALTVAGCAPRPAAAPAPSLLRLEPAERTLTLCQGTVRHVAVGASWTGSARPEVAGLPEISWLSGDPAVVRVDGRTGSILGLRPGTATVIVHGRIGTELGRATLSVTVLEGTWDAAASSEAGRLGCRPG